MATLAVIFLHTNNTLSNNAEVFGLTGAQYVFFTTGTHLMNWAVPVFLMITGSLLLNRNISYGQILKIYVKRIVLALFIFGVPFSMAESFMESRSINVGMIGEAVVNVINGDSWGHLWYLYALIGLYLVLPLFKPAVDNLSRREFRILLLVMFVLNFCVGIVNQVPGVHIAFQLPMSYTVFYVLLGKYMAQVYVMGDRWGGLRDKRLCVAGIAVMAVLIIVGCTFLDAGTYFGYASPMIAVMAVLVFCLFKDLDVGQQWKDRIWKMDRICFGMYLVHPVFTNFFYKFLSVSPLSFGKLYPVGVLLFWLLFVVMAMVASLIMNMIRPLRKWVL